MKNGKVFNKQEVELATMDEFVSKLYAIMKRDQLENKQVIFECFFSMGHNLHSTNKLLIKEERHTVFIKLK